MWLRQLKAVAIEQRHGGHAARRADTRNSCGVKRLDELKASGRAIRSTSVIHIPRTTIFPAALIQQR